MGAMALKSFFFWVIFIKFRDRDLSSISHRGLVIMFLPMTRMLMMFVAIMMMNSRTILIKSKAGSVVGISIYATERPSRTQQAIGQYANIGRYI